MFQKSAKSATELECIITAELREHPECESAAVSVRPTGAVGMPSSSARCHKLMTPARRNSPK